MRETSYCGERKIESDLDGRGAGCRKFVSPNARWSEVRQALQGANIVVYTGHGNGYEAGDESKQPGAQDAKNGWYLDEDASLSDEGGGSGRITRAMIQNEVTLAPSALVIMKNACYVAGKTSNDSEGNTPLDVMKRRIEEYSDTFLPMSANYFAANTLGEVAELFSKMAESGQTFGQALGEIASEWTSSNKEIISGFETLDYAHPEQTGKEIRFTRFTWNPDSGYSPGENNAVGVGAGDMSLTAPVILLGETQ